MKSKIAQRILNKTPIETKLKVGRYGDILMNNKISSMEDKNFLTSNGIQLLSSDQYCVEIDEKIISHDIQMTVNELQKEVERYFKKHQLDVYSSSDVTKYIVKLYK